MGQYITHKTNECIEQVRGLVYSRMSAINMRAKTLDLSEPQFLSIKNMALEKIFLKFSCLVLTAYNFMNHPQRKLVQLGGTCQDWAFHPE